VKQPRRDSAFALLAGLAVVTAVYTLVQLVVVATVPAVAGTAAPLAAAGGRLVGRGGVLLITLGAMVSTYGLATGSVLAAPRLLFSMAEGGQLPSGLARVHPRFRTPDAAIVSYAAVTLGFALYGSFRWNAMLSAIARLVTYGLMCGALVVLRRRGGEPPGFRLPLASLVVPVALGFCLWLLSTRTFAQAWILVLLVAAGAALEAVSTRRRALE
jgi:amino acid transporter